MEVAEKKAAETAQKLSQFWYEAGQAVVQSTFEVQGRSLQYMQNTFKDGVETLKSHIEASEHLLQRANMSQEQQDSIPSIMESGAETYKRNMNFLQRTFDGWVEVFMGNSELMRDMTQKMIDKAQEQRGMFWS
ncbi:MAG: hypothetical protein J2P36_02590 [Ktedonobacteraceae bacterium]|nr:hypothetical protein [Ktedonobacteraceae bacterium]